VRRISAGALLVAARRRRSERGIAPSRERAEEIVPDVWRCGKRSRDFRGGAAHVLSTRGISGIPGGSPETKRALSANRYFPLSGGNEG
jgi:hypothetical protein